MEHFETIIGERASPDRLACPNRCGCRGVIPLQAMQVTFTVTTQMDA